MGFWKDFAFTNAIFAKDEGDFLANSLIYIHEAEREDREKEEKKKREQEEKKNRAKQNNNEENGIFGIIAFIIVIGFYIIWYSIIGIINLFALLFDVITKGGKKENGFNIKKYRFGSIIIAIITITLTIAVIINQKQEVNVNNTELSYSNVSEESDNVNMDSKVNNDIVEKEEQKQEKIDYTNLETISLSKIKKDLENGLSYDVKKKYVGNSYIFTAKVFEIYDDHFRTPLEGYSGCKMYMNNQELDKLKNLKVGDTVKCCGKMKKIGIYYTIVFENVSIID